MKVYLFRTPQGLIVSRTSPTEIVDGNEGSDTQVAELEIKHEGRLTADNPDLQTLLCAAFTEGARWQQQHSDTAVREWPVT